MLPRLTFLLVLLCSLSLAAAADAPAASPAQLPSDPPGTLLIEDSDAASVVYSFTATHSKTPPTLPASGGTITRLNPAKTSGDGSNKVSINPNIPAAGYYQLWLRWNTFPTVIAQHATNVPASVFSKAGEFSFKINQQSGNQWILLGTYEFDAGQKTILTLSNLGTIGLANWDALKLIPVAAKPTPRPAPAPLPGQDGFAKLARNISYFEVASAYGRGNDESDPDAIRMAALNEIRARSLFDLLLENPTEKSNSNWTQTGNSASFHLTREADNIKRMAVAYVGASNHLGLDLRGNPQLLKATFRAIENFKKRYNETTRWDVNWWDFEIGIPLRILPALIVLGDSVPPETRDSFIAATKKFNSDPRKFYNNGSLSTGANRLWLCHVAMLRAALAKDAPLLELVKSSIMEPLEFVNREAAGKDKKTSTDGYYADGSFIQHGGIPYVAAYGYLLLETYAQVAECLQNTPWQLDGPAAANAFSIIEICFDPFVVRGETVSNVVGRSLGSKNYEGNENAANFVVTASKLLPFANPEQAARVRALIKKWITDEPTGALLAIALKSADASNPVSLVALKQIAQDKSLAPLPPRTGFQMFPNMDIATHRTAGITASLGMNSTRTTTFETIWGANKRGWFQSEGLLLLYTPDIERYRDAYFQLVDHYRLPGTTIERFERPEGDGGGANPGKRGGSDFVGGLALDSAGLAVMHLKPAVGNLEARKAWFFLQDQIICLAAGITSTSENPVETTLENARLLADSQKLLVDNQPAPQGPAEFAKPKWAHLAGSRPAANLAWVFLDSNPPLHTLLETRQGSRQNNSKNGDPTPLSMKFATLYFDHGKSPKDASFAYAILPNRSPEQTAAYSEKPPIHILANTPALQAIREPATGFSLLAFHSPGEFEKISTSEPLLIALHDQPATLSIALADPTMKLTKTITLRFPQTVKSITTPNDRIKVLSQSPLTLEFAPTGANGQPQRIEFAK